MPEQRTHADESAAEEFGPEASSSRVDEYLEAQTESAEQDAQARTYLDSLERRIDEEVARMRAEGRYPPSLSRRVRTYYRTLLPDGAASGQRDFDAIFRTVDRIAYMDIDVPTASAKPGVGFAKRTLRTLMAWYLNYLAQQFNNFATNLVHLLGITDDRIGAVEARMDTAAFKATYLLDSSASVQVQAETSARVAEILSDVRGRVLVAECADGSLLERLAQNGLNAYGIESRPGLLQAAESRSLELREAETLEHLAGVAAGSLSALVLSGIVDRDTISNRVAVLAHARRALEEGAPLVLACASPHAFDDPANRIEADLSPGRPFAPQTWEFLLGKLGFDSVVSEQFGTGQYLVVGGNARRAPELGALADSKVVLEALQPPKERRR